MLNPIVGSAPGRGMSLIDKIDGSLITRLSGTSGAASTSAIGGKGTGASFDKGAVDLSDGLSNLASAFESSVLRLAQPLNSFQKAKRDLGGLVDLAEEMVELADRASSENTDVNERGAINSSFQQRVQEFRAILNKVSSEESNYFSKAELRDKLKEAGISTDAGTPIAAFFRALSPDGELGMSSIASEDAIVFTNSGVEVATALSTTDPLQQNLQTQGGAVIAATALRKLQTDLEEDLKNTTGVVEELVGALNFGIIGSQKSYGLADGAAVLLNANQVAQRLVNGIKSGLSDPSLGSHSDIDRSLAQALLSEQ